MHWPTRKPVTFLPALKSATAFSFLAITSCTMARIAPSSDTCLRPMRSTMASTVSSVSNMLGRTFLPALPEMVPASISLTRATSLSAVILVSRRLTPLSFRYLEISDRIQFAAALGLTCFAAASSSSAFSKLSDSRRASMAVMPYSLR